MTGLTSNAVPGSAEECPVFQHLQARLPVQFRSIFPHRTAPRTVVVVPA
jgi:hypothetical protein